MSVTVSVIVPTHSRPHFLSRTVDSLLAQTYKDIEVVVVDDNAPDSPTRQQTAEVMARYADDERVKYILNRRCMGGGLARNVGITCAAGEYITFLDDDDIYLPQKVESQLKFMLENGLDMSFTDVFIHNGNNELVEYRRHSYVSDCSNHELLRQHILHSLCPTSSYMIKKKVLCEMGGFRGVPMGQDFMLMWDIINYGARIGYFPVSYIIQYLHNENRISLGNNKINGEKALYALKKKKFCLLSHSERRYVRFRHLAVLSVTCKRSGRPLCAAIYALRCGMTSPVSLIRESVKRTSNRRLADTCQQGAKRFAD